MTSEFSRIITLLRKERGITQKQAAADLGVSQALLSHYEKGIRECGLEFVVKVADYYNVSCDYLLGRSADRNGLTLNMDDLPETDNRADTRIRGGVLAVVPVMEKRLIMGALNILYDKLAASQNKSLVGEVSDYLMLAVYKMFRLLYASNSKNAEDLFKVSPATSAGYSTAAMLRAEANVQGMLAGENTEAGQGVKDAGPFAMTTATITQEYPLYATSLLNLIKTCESRIEAS